MFREVLPFNILEGLKQWALASAALAAVVIGIAIVASLILNRGGFLRVFMSRTREALVDLIAVSPRRIGAISLVTIKESVRRKALLVFVVFTIVFMFANWFLGDDRELSAAKPYISTVLMALNWMIIPVALLLSCWGLPADIKDRSLHTVVTKPVRRSEVLLGRMLGYTAVSLVMLAAMGAVGYLWIIRSVPAQAQDQLIGRVPHYGTLSYLDDSGVPTEKGINVGDMWTYRSFVSGATKACGIYTFEGIDVDAIRDAGFMRLEYKWEAFRTYKGDIVTPVRFRIYLINPDNDLTVRLSASDFEIQEFATGVDESVIDIPIHGIPPREGADGAFYVTAEGADLSTAGGQFDPQRLSLVDDLISSKGNLIVRVYCVDNQQHIGMARHDLFIRLPDRSFAASYFKSLINTALMVILIVVLGTTASCFLNGPIATIFTFGLIILGQGLRQMMDSMMAEFYEKKQILGGGPLESAYRLLTQMNQQGELPENLQTEFIRNADLGILHTVGLTRNFFPNFNHFDTREFLANGFDVPFNASVLAALAVTLSFILPCYVIGYLSLRHRELELK
jgi:hypothetical protein